MNELRITLSTKVKRGKRISFPATTSLRTTGGRLILEVEWDKGWFSSEPGELRIPEDISEIAELDEQLVRHHAENAGIQNAKVLPLGGVIGAVVNLASPVIAGLTAKSEGLSALCMIYHNDLREIGRIVILGPTPAITQIFQAMPEEKRRPMIRYPPRQK